MPWVTFTARFYFTPPASEGRVTIRYEAGQSLLVTRPCAASAVRSGKAIYVARPPVAPATGGRDAIRQAS